MEFGMLFFCLQGGKVDTRIGKKYGNCYSLKSNCASEMQEIAQ